MENFFNILQKKHPELSSFIIFQRSMHLTDGRRLRKDFESFVDKKDYLRSEKEQILKWLRIRLKSLSNF